LTRERKNLTIGRLDDLAIWRFDDLIFDFGFGILDLFGIWNLEFGIY
jgi:hypothetical protein